MDHNQHQQLSCSMLVGQVLSQEATNLHFSCSILCGLVCKTFLVLKAIILDTLNVVFWFLLSKTCYIEEGSEQRAARNLEVESFLFGKGF